MPSQETKSDDAKSRDPPKWLDSEYIAKALQKALKEPLLTVTSCNISPATAVGDNYASLMFRANLKIVKKPSAVPANLSVVMKTMPRGDVKDLMEEPFMVEIKMLVEILPIINNALQKVVPGFQPLSAKCLHYGTEPETVIMLQDLKELGFSLADRMNGLDMDTSKLVLKAIAQIHAGSLLIKKNTPELLESFMKNMWADDEKGFLKTMLESSLAGLIEAASEWDDFPADYLEKLRGLTGQLFQKMLEVVEFTNKKSLGVLQHGDCWINNMMFKSDGSKYNGFRFVDFQISHINSAAMDLNYFIFTSPAADIRLKNIEEMLQTYYEAFMDITERLNLEVPPSYTFEELKREFRSHAFFGFVSVMIVYPITITKEKDALNVNDFFDESASKKAQYSSKKFKDVFNMVMPYFIECGVI